MRIAYPHHRKYLPQKRQQELRYTRKGEGFRFEDLCNILTEGPRKEDSDETFLRFGSDDERCNYKV